jgi:two-component system, response regulator YesN
MKARRGSLFRSFLVSYVAVLALPLCVLVFFYYPYTTRAVIDRETSWNAQAVQQLRLSWESFLRYAYSLPSAIERNQSIRFSGAEAPGYRRYIIANEMRKYSAADDYVFDIFLYIKSDGYLFSKNGTAYTIDDFGRPGDGYYFPRWNHDELVRDLSGSRGPLVRGAEDIIAPTMNRVRVITLVRPLSPSSAGNFATLVMLVREDALTGAMRAASEERKGSFFIIDPSGRTVASIGDASPFGEPAAFMDSIPAGDGGVLSIAGVPCVAARSRSSPERWSYVSVFPVSGRLAELRAVQARTLALVLAILLLEALIIRVSLNKNFYPLKRLAASLGSASPQAAGANEIAVIHGALDGLVAAKASLDERLREALPMLRDAAARDILKSSYDTRARLDGALAVYGIALEHPLLAVAVFRFQGPGTQDRAELRALEGRFPEGLDGAFLCAGPDIVLVCSHRSEVSIKDFLEASLPQVVPREMALATGIGRSTASPRELRTSYAQALQAADSSAKDAGSIVEFEKARGEGSAPIHRYLDLPRALELAIRADDERLIEELIERIIDLVGSGRMEDRLARNLYLNAISVVLEGLRRFRGDADDFASLASLVFYDSYTIDEMSEILRSSADRLRTLLSDDLDEGVDSPGKAEIAAYVDSADICRELSLKTAAERFGMKESSFSYRFKRVMGENFKEYAERRRIEASKALLIETDESIESIADKVGFSSAGSSSFIRAFKKSVGITPKRFREATRSSQRA